jgi:RNA polymerase sigma factor (sigma-70 family)
VTETGAEVGQAGPLTAALFNELYPRLRRFAAVVADRDVDPDDLVQEAVASYLRRFAGTSGADVPEAYLRVGVVGAARNHRRSAARRRRREHGERPVAGATDSYPSDVVALLASTTSDERALLWLVDVEGQPISDAAQVVEISATAARARLSRVRRRLRKELAMEEDR